jgi:ATP-dependent RNA helicase DDX35
MQRPGSRSKSAFGLSFDQPAGGGGGVSGQSAPASSGAVLPVSARRREILWLVEQHGVVVLVGETGTGKTTQVPQFLIEAGACRAQCPPRLLAP